MGVTLYLVIALVSYVLFKITNFFLQVYSNPWPVKKFIANPLETDKDKRKQVIKRRFAKKDVEGKTYDVIVVGSGISGLACAGALAREGKKVLVLEQLPGKLGGCTHTFKKEGYEFDIGVHYFGEVHEGTFDRILFDYITDGQLEFEKMDKHFDDVVLVKEGQPMKKFPWISGKGDYERNLKKLFPDEEHAIDEYCKYLKESGEAMKQLIFLKVLPKKLVRFLYDYTPMFKLYKKYASVTVKEYVDGLTKNAELKLMLCYSYGDYGVVPSESSILMHGTLMKHFYYGGYYPKGGASQFAYTIIPGITRNGGDAMANATVKEILFGSDGAAKGVSVLWGNEEVHIKAPIVVSAAGVINTFTKLVPNRISKFSDPCIALDHLRSGMSCIQMFVGLKGDKEELNLAARNSWIFDDEDLEEGYKKYSKCSIEDILTDKKIPLLFVSFPSTKDSTFKSRCPDKTTCTIVTFGNWEWFDSWENEPVKKRGTLYKNLKQEFQNKIWQQVIEVFPQLEGKVEYMDLGTPLTHSHYIASPRGEIYGMHQSVEKFKRAVELHPDTGIKGLYITGQDILTCGVTGGFISGLITAGTVLGRAYFVKLLKYVIAQKALYKKGK